MNIYTNIRLLAKSVKGQNLFTAAKDISGIQLFKNKFNLSQIQEYYLSYLYIYDTINRDIIVEKISPHVLDCELFEDSYLLWKKLNKNVEKKEEKSISKDMHLVCGNKIIFPTEVK
jgi:hypothetical protein